MFRLLHLAIIEDMEDIACSIIRNISSPSDLLNSFNYMYQVSSTSQVIWL